MSATCTCDPRGTFDGPCQGARDANDGPSPADEIREHPDYYNWHPAGIECWDVVEPFGFNLGNAIKYIWRAGRKHDSKDDLEKAVHYLQRELKRLPE